MRREVGHGVEDGNCVPVQNVHFSPRLLSVVLCVAERMESTESSMPATFSNFSARERAKRPAPQYASTKCVGCDAAGVVTVEEGGKMASRTQGVRGTSTELLFWKKDPAL